jgi:hypothetical protein
MSASSWLLLAADAVLVLHTLFVGFVVLGLALILAGGALGWRWVRNPWFRAAHLAAIGIVVAQSWLGLICPLTTLEAELRRRAGEEAYAGSFIEYWLARLLYYQAPEWVFVALYTVFALLVAGSWLIVRPRSFAGGRRDVTR